jgi:hypothetical protein
VIHEQHCEDKKLLNINTEDDIIAATKLPYKRWINWNKEFLEKVKKEGVKDNEYLEHLNSLGKEDVKTESTIY